MTFAPRKFGLEQKVTSRGLRWVRAMLLVNVACAARIWGRPVLTALTPSKAWCERHKRRYRPVTEWAERLLLTPGCRSA